MAAQSQAPAPWLLDGLRMLVTDINAQTELTLEAAESYKVRIELLYRELLAMELESGVLSEYEAGALLNLSKAYDLMNGLVDRLTSVPPSNYLGGPVMVTGRTGRPSFHIPFEQLQCLIEFRFSVPQIAQLLGISVRTVRRRMSEAGLSIQGTYSQLTDDQLDEIIYVIRQQFPNCGNRQMYGHLLSKGIRVQYHRVGESQYRIDPEGSVLRRLRTIKRRKYSVKGPQHLWHIDGNHKLIRYVVLCMYVYVTLWLTIRQPDPMLWL